MDSKRTYHSFQKKERKCFGSFTRFQSFSATRPFDWKPITKKQQFRFPKGLFSFAQIGGVNIYIRVLSQMDKMSRWEKTPNWKCNRTEKTRKRSKYKMSQDRNGYAKQESYDQLTLWASFVPRIGHGFYSLYKIRCSPAATTVKTLSLSSTPIFLV